MRNKQNISNYIDETNLNAVRTGVNSRVSPVVFLLSVFSAAFIMLLAIQPVFVGIFNKNSGTSANAFGLVCSTTMGAGMNDRSPWAQSSKDYPLPGKTGRTWTIQESLSGGIGVVNYSGEGEGNEFLVTSKEKPTGSNYKKYAAQYSDKLEAERGWNGCAMGTLLGSFANLGLKTADLISGLAQFFAVKAFDTELICPNPSRPNGSCLNLGKVVGGTGSETGGIIGALTSSVYMPLLVLAVAIAAGWILFIGIVKRRIREALIGAIWIALSIIIGLALLLNPSLLAKAPISLSNAVSTCVIGAFNGENCMTMGSTGSGIDGDVNSSKNVCRSAVSGASIPESMMLTTNAITCSIWKAFVLEPYAQISFGMSFEDLDTKNGAIASTVKETGMTGNEFCVDTYSSRSYNQMKDGVLQLNGGTKVCNLLAYQMMLKVEVKSGDESLPASGSIDDRWYKIVAVAAANDAVWSHWAGNAASGMNQLMLSLLAVITSALGSFIIIITSVFALVYYISTVLLMAFAPVFLLIGIHPGRGKKIMFGWLEKVVSNILKYFVSAVFLVVTLVIYGSILSSATNMGLILMFVIIVTMALFMYRQELMNMLGRANMGGEQLSGALATSLGNMAQGVGRSGKGALKSVSTGSLAVAGGGLGALAASKGVSGREKLGNTFSGMKDAAKRHTSRQGGIIGNAARQYERSSVDNQRDLRKQTQDAQTEFIDYGNDVVKSQKEVDDKQLKVNSAVAQAKQDEQAYKDVDGRLKDFRNAESETLHDMREESMSVSDKRIAVLDDEIDEIARDSSLSPEEKRTRTEQKEAEIAQIEKNNRIVLDFANYQGLLNELQEARMNYSYAESIGDHEMMAHYGGIIEEKEASRDDLYDSIGARNVSVLSRKYNNDLQDHLNKNGIQEFSNEEFENYQELRVKVNTSEEALGAVRSQKAIADADHELNIAMRDRQEIIYNTYEKTLRELKPGQSLQQHDLAKMQQNINKQLNDANLSDAHIQGLEAKRDELRADGSEFTLPHLSKVDGRLDNRTGYSDIDGELDLNDGNAPIVANNRSEVPPSASYEGQRTDQGSQMDVPMPTPVDPNAGNYAEPDDRFAPPAEDERLPFDPQVEAPIPVQTPPNNDADSRSAAASNNSYEGQRKPRKTQRDDPMPTPVDPNAGNYAEPDDRFAPPAEDERLPFDPQDDRAASVPMTRESTTHSAADFTPPPQRKEKAEQFKNPVGNNDSAKNNNEAPKLRRDDPMPTPVDPNAGNYAEPDERFAPPAEDEVLPPAYETSTNNSARNGSNNVETPRPAPERQKSEEQKRGIPNKKPTNKIAPPPFAPDEPMPTPVDPNAGSYEDVDDRFAPPAEDEVLPSDSKEDRKKILNNKNQHSVDSARSAGMRAADKDAQNMNRKAREASERAYNEGYSERLNEKMNQASDNFDEPVAPAHSVEHNNSERIQQEAKARGREAADRRNPSPAKLNENFKKVEEEEFMDKHFAEQQELLMNDDEETQHFARDEGQERVRDRFRQGAQDAINRNKELRKESRPRRSLPTSPQRKDDDE